MPRSLADAKKRLVSLAARPANINAITETEATGVAVKLLGCNILSSDYDYGPTGSETVNEKDLCTAGNGQAFGMSNFGGGFTIFREFDPVTGQPDPADDWAWDLAKEKGTVLYLLERTSGTNATEPFKAGDEYRYYEVVTDDPKSATLEGYIKQRIELGHKDAALDKLIVAP